MFIDTHVHLNSEQLITEYKEVIQRAYQAGVTKMIVIGYDRDTSITAIKIARQYDFVFASVGFHPTEVANITPEDYEWLEEAAKHPKVVAIGECGYDFHWKLTTQQQQKLAFKKQIQIAKEVKKPLIIHMRDATQATFDTLREYDAFMVGGVMHCYSGSFEMAKQFIDMNFYISLGGPVTFKNAVEAKKIASEIDLTHLLSETDSPYLSPDPFRGQINEPKNVTLVVEEIANLRNQSVEHVASILMKNAEKLFAI
jgi:TatD DNase family protein